MGPRVNSEWQIKKIDRKMRELRRCNQNSEVTYCYFCELQTLVHMKKRYRVPFAGMRTTGDHNGDHTFKDLERTRHIRVTTPAPFAQAESGELL